MPIKFRCRHCRQFLGISRAQAGEITNCPQCGKAIRVPALDGSVAPIPAPKLDFDDSQLADALSELAQLESESSPNQTIDDSVVLPTVQTKERLVSAPPAKVVAFPATVLVETVTHAPQRASSVDTAQGTAVDEGTHDALSSLAESVAEPKLSDRHRIDHNGHWKMIATVIGFLILLALVWFLRGGDRPNNDASPVATDTPAANDPPPVDAPPANLQAVRNSPALTGRITYTSDTGDSQPDSGAVAMLLPFPRLGQVKLDETGFLSGAADIDSSAAAAGLRVLGGDVTTADDDGQYQLHVSTAGDYRLLVISHHRRRIASQTVETRVQETLSGYFFRPPTLLGQLSFHFDDFHYRGQGTSSRDITFSLE